MTDAHLSVIFSVFNTFAAVAKTPYNDEIFLVYMFPVCLYAVSAGTDRAK